MNDQEIFEIMEKSRQALSRIKKYKASTEKDPLKLLHETLQKAHMGQDLFEPYDALSWEGKVRVDMLYFEALLQKLDCSQVESLQEALGVYFRNIRQIYEHVNIKPEIYGKDISIFILEDSNEQARQKISNVIYEYLDKYFYKLSPEQRVNKYQDTCTEFAKQLIMEGNDPDKAIEFAIKTRIVENLLTKIAFPFASWSRIKFLTESEDYGRVFDQSALIDLVESFERRVHSLAKIISAIV